MDAFGRVIHWGMWFGLIGFLGGFFGPMLLSQSNQGPLLGIFITGPLGFLLGTLAGAIREIAQSAKSNRRGHCIKCGYDLRGDFSGGCPECGWQREAEA